MNKKTKRNYLLLTIIILSTVAIMYSVTEAWSYGNFTIHNHWTNNSGTIRSAGNFNSTIWNKTESIQLCSDGSPYNCITRLKNPNISIQYNTRIKNLDTGEIVQCGSSVPTGTRLKFEFSPHNYRDITWFATGYSVDSPYGKWTNGASFTGSKCSSGNYVSYDSLYDPTFNFWYAMKTFVSFVVNPPTKSITNRSGLSSCGNPDSNGSITCTANTAGSITPKFNFGNTYGKFYSYGPSWGWDASVGVLSGHINGPNAIDKFEGYSKTFSVGLLIAGGGRIYSDSNEYIGYFGSVEFKGTVVGITLQRVKTVLY